MALLAIAICAVLPQFASAAGARVQAVAGEPFGVCEISFPVESNGNESWQCRATGIHPTTDRILFPILEHPGLLRRLSSQMDGNLPQAPKRTGICFLFTGSTPFEVTIGGSGEKILITPEPHRPAKHARLSRKWWKHIWGPLGDRLRDSSRPRPVESYLAGMGLWRLGINRHPVDRPTTIGQMDEIILGTSRLRADMLRAVAFDRNPATPAALPIPEPIRWSTTPAKPLGDVEIEPIAERVPSNCFYIRFGRYTNMLWATRLLEEHGEELSRLITLRGFRGDSSAKVQRQLNIQKLPFAELIGNQLISDVALVGRDIFLIDGPAFGVILKSDSKLLASGLKNLRRDALKKWKEQGATLETRTIADHDVSLLSTPGFELRSFHVEDDGYHFISNSETMVRQFLGTNSLNKSQDTLAELPEFQYARWLMPPEKKDYVFAYVSTDFLKSLTEPAYVTELMRRMRARAELTTLEVAVAADKAVMAAQAAAGSPVAAISSGDMVADLKARQMLPPNFGLRSDGSRPMWQGGSAVDSLRGAVGTFLPIADVPVNFLSPKEDQMWSRFANHHVGNWAAIDPVIARIRREKVPNRPNGTKSERLIVDARVAPLQRSNATILMGLLGESRARRFDTPEDAVISAEAIVNRSWTATNADSHVRLSVADGEHIPPIFSTKLLELLRLAKQLPVTTVVQPANAAFDRRWWRRDPANPNDENFYGPLGLIGRPLDNYGAIVWDDNLLNDLPPTIETKPTKNPGQLWLTVKELGDCSLTEAVKGIAAVRATEGSLRNAQVFHQWTSLLGLPVADGPELTKRLVNMTPVCPLDGEYQLAMQGDCEHWRSTSWGDQLSLVDVQSYSPALLKWFHGLDARLLVSGEGLELHADLMVEFEEEKGPESSDEAMKSDKKKSLFDKLPFSKGLFPGNKDSSAE